jgi:hypothetical protein
VNPYLHMAAVWVLVGVGLQFIPDTRPDSPIVIDQDRRFWGGTGATLLAGYNIVRWWRLRSRVQAQEAARLQQLAPRRHHHREEPPNPDFDFSDDKDRRD